MNKPLTFLAALPAALLCSAAARAEESTYRIEGTNASVTLSERDRCYQEKFGRNQQELAAKIGSASLFGCPIKVNGAIAGELQRRFDAIARAAENNAPVQRWRDHLFDARAHEKIGGYQAKVERREKAIASAMSFSADAIFRSWADMVIGRHDVNAIKFA